MRTKNKFLLSIIAIMLSCVIMFTMIAVNMYMYMASVSSSSAAVRTVDISRASLDAQSVFDEFENYAITNDGSTAYFEGYKTFNDKELREIDYIVNDKLEEQTSCIFKYNVSYDAESNIVTIKVEAQEDYGDTDVCEIKGTAFVNTDGEIDAIMDMDGETILLSELRQAGLINNCGWLSRLIKAVVAIISPVVAVVVHIVEESYAISNYKHNQTLDNQVEKFINGQGRSPYSKFKFGIKEMSENGCGPIATYNVMRLLTNLGKIKNMPKFSDIIYDIERLSGTLLFGQFGEDPTSIKEYFSNNGISSKAYTNHNDFDNALSKMEDTQHAILCFWTNKNQIPGNAHYVAVTNNHDNESQSKYKVYNRYNEDKDVRYYDTLDGILNGGAIIAGMIIN